MEVVKFGKRAVGFEEQIVPANRRLPRKGQCRTPQDALQAYQRKVGAFSPLAGTQQRKNVLAVWEVLLNLGESCGVCELAVDSLQSSASQRSSSSAVQSYSTYA